MPLSTTQIWFINLLMLALVIARAWPPGTEAMARLTFSL